MPGQPIIRVFPTVGELFYAGAALFAERCFEAVKQTGRFTVALSGGSTPKGLFNLLSSTATPALPWDKLYFFWGDERHVPPDHPDSNFRMTSETLLSKLGIAGDHIFRVKAELPDADAVAEDYQRRLQDFFALQSGQLPRFDLVFLGLGPDGHTASLFPGSTAVQETQKLVVATWVEKFRTHRISMTYPVLNNAACVAFLVAGEDKAPAVKRVLAGDASLPATGIKPANGQLIWLLDAEAASGLPAKERRAS